MIQKDLFTFARDEATYAKERGIAQADRSAGPSFKAHALAAIEHVSRMQPTFTSEEVTARLRFLDQMGDKNPAALGLAFRTAANLGLIVNTGQRRQSTTRECHRTRDVWRRA